MESDSSFFGSYNSSFDNNGLVASEIYNCRFDRRCSKRLKTAANLSGSF